jgi:O-antigen ligase
VLLAVVCAIAATLGLVTQWDHVRTRISSSEHLEAWSLLTRTESFVQGWQAIQRRPFVGWGPGADLLGITEVRKQTQWERIAPEPPHAAPVAFVLETGILGILAMIALVGAMFLEIGRVKREGKWKMENGKWKRVRVEGDEEGGEEYGDVEKRLHFPFSIFPFPSPSTPVSRSSSRSS